MPRVLNIHRDVIPPDAVNVMRGRGKWGNPFRIGPDGDRQTVIDKHRAWLMANPRLMRALPELRGKDLVCCCAPLPCHADTLRQLANA